MLCLHFLLSESIKFFIDGGVGYFNRLAQVILIEIKIELEVAY